MRIFELSKNPELLCKHSLVVIKDGDYILTDEKTHNIFFQQSKLGLSEQNKQHAIFIGELDGDRIFAVEQKALTVEHATYIKANMLLDTLLFEERKALYRSCQLLNWHHQSNFCGSCGSLMRMATDEFSKRCNADPEHHYYYPQYSPSIIVLITDKTKLLLGRSYHFPKGRYSTLAGFVEAGETAEEAVRREVMEEVGIEVKNILPISTAPWPFPNSLMLAFEAEAVTSELYINKDELEDAQWFEYNKLPILPPKATISHDLIMRGVAICATSSKSSCA